MAVPKKKTTPSRMKMRRSHQALESVNYVSCPNCGSDRLPHHICPTCGYYNGRAVLKDKRVSE